MGNYRVVDLRGKYCPAASSWGNSSKGYGVVAHYNGGPVPTRAWRDPIAWIRFIIGLHRQPGRFAPGWTINGSAYHEFIYGRTVYRVRNYGADLPHCGNLAWNRNSLGLHVPVGGSQRPAQAGSGTLATLQQRADDHLRAMGKPRSALKGHREVGSSLCPGEPIMAGIRHYRSGASIDTDFAPAPKSAPEPAGKPPAEPETNEIPLKRINICFEGNKDEKTAEAYRTAINALSRWQNTDSYARIVGGGPNIRYAAEGAWNSTDGYINTVVLGRPAVKELAEYMRDALAKDPAKGRLIAADGDSWADTNQLAKWRLSYHCDVLAERVGFDAQEAKDIAIPMYEAQMGDAPKA